MRLASIEGLGGFTETAGKSVVDERELQNTLEGLKNGHLAFAGSGIGADFDFASGGFDGGGGLFSVRLKSFISIYRIPWWGWRHCDGLSAM